MYSSGSLTAFQRDGHRKENCIVIKTAAAAAASSLHRAGPNKQVQRMHSHRVRASRRRLSSASRREKITTISILRRRTRYYEGFAILINNLRRAPLSIVRCGRLNRVHVRRNGTSVTVINYRHRSNAEMQLCLLRIHVLGLLESSVRV